jgi:uncharacterized alkaline shock family protein YloU
MNPEDNTSNTEFAVAGDIVINPQVLFSLALEAALSTYGVVGIASRYTGFDMTHRDPHRGLEVKTTQTPDGPTHIVVNAHVVVEYGVRISAVISSLQQQITYRIEHSTGYTVDSVNVHVSGLHVTHED